MDRPGLGQYDMVQKKDAPLWHLGLMIPSQHHSGEILKTHCNETWRFSHPLAMTTNA
ncbi:MULTISPECIES: hypothetical protein [Halomonas]|uniref:hypothetical protein n=1 Tax=Halomonas TaxID=2745 RepID=UPI001868E9A5|nr:MULTISPECIES: hypothetical protein [Halomonas]